MFGLKAMVAFLRKDLEDAVRSHTFLLILIGPVILSVFFARFFAGEDVRHPVVAVCDQSASPFVQALESTGLFTIVEDDNWEQCLSQVERGQYAGAVRIPIGFVESICNGGYPRLDMAVNEASLAQSAIVREGVRGALRHVANQELPADVRVVKVNRFSGEKRLSILPIWVVFTCLSGLMITSSSLVEEVESKTLDAVLMAPVQLGEVLFGKVAAGFVMTLLASALVLFLNCGGSGNTVSMLILLVLASLMSVVFGCVLGLVVANQATANALSSILYIILFMPIAFADVSVLMRSLAQWLPTWYLYDGLCKSLFVGSSLSELAGSVAGLTISIAVLVIVGATVLHRRRVHVVG